MVRAYRSQKGITLLEVVLYATALTGFLLVVSPAAFRLLHSLDGQADRLSGLVDMQLLEQRLALIFSCGSLAEVRPAAVVVQCFDHTETVTYEADGAIRLLRSSEADAHMLTFAGQVQASDGQPFFSLLPDAAGALRVHMKYKKMDLAWTYYAFPNE